MADSIARRRFLQTSAAAASLMAAPSPLNALAASGRKLELGFDNFSIRALNWKADRILEYAHSLGVDSVLFSDLDVYDSHDPGYLKDLKAKADGLGLKLYAGTGGVCPSSGRFIDKYGSAEDHLALVIRVAETLGSPVARCYLGSGQDRTEGGGIRHHMQVLVDTLKKVRGIALDAGVTIAVENHAGDMQARELAWVCEQAGPDFVGVTIDSGNATWTLENPQANLEILGPYTVCSGIRDSAVWESENGAYVSWASPGDGDMDWDKYVATWLELCPEAPFILEIINWIDRPREYPYLNEEFWTGYEDVLAADFARFVKMAKTGSPYSHPDDRPGGERSDELMQKQQLYDLERSVAFCKKLLAA